jgi:membrane protein
MATPRLADLDPMPIWRGAWRLVRFVRHVVLRFDRDGCFGTAGALSFTTLMSLVPILAISLGILSAFPMFAAFKDRALQLAFSTLVPRVGDTVAEYVATFTEMAGQTTALGLAVLGCTAVLLIATIEQRLDEIWRVHSPRPWFLRLTVYWTVLTLGPVLFGVALSLSTEPDGLKVFLDAHPDLAAVIGDSLRVLAFLLPWMIETLGLTILYSLLPHCPVRWRDAAIGAAVAGGLLEVCRAGLAVYLEHFDSYHAIYGALAAIPIFLLSMYSSWSVVLFGAEIAAALPRWEIEGLPRRTSAPPDLDLALDILQGLETARRRGASARPAGLARALGRATGPLVSCLEQLAEAGFAVEGRDGAFVLGRDLATATLADLALALEDGARRSARPELARLQGDLAKARERVFDRPLTSLLDLAGAPEPAQTPAGRTV